MRKDNFEIFSLSKPTSFKETANINLFRIKIHKTTQEIIVTFIGTVVHDDIDTSMEEGWFVWFFCLMAH